MRPASGIERTPRTAEQIAHGEADYFDGLTKGGRDFDNFSLRAWANLRKRFVDALAPARPVELLDVGCGTGQSRQVYRDSCSRYVGLDISRESLLRARTHFPTDTWVLGDAMRMPFESASFDVVAFSSVLHHIPDRHEALREAMRVLRPDGLVFAYDPNLRHPALALFRHPKSPLYDPRGVSPFECPLFPSELRSSLVGASFDRVRTVCQADLPYRKVDVPWINRLLPIYNAVDWVVEAIGLGRIIGSFVISTARRPDALRATAVR